MSMVLSFRQRLADYGKRRTVDARGSTAGFSAVRPVGSLGGAAPRNTVATQISRRQAPIAAQRSPHVGGSVARAALPRDDAAGRMGDVDYYAILEVGPEAESDEIEDAYQRAVTRARRDEPGRARMLGEARAVLLDPSTRAEYDARCVGPAVIEETVAAIMEAYRSRVDVRRFVRARDFVLAALRAWQDARLPSS
jgi:hypothetical protein